MPLTRTLLRSAVAAAAVVTLALVAHTDVVATAVGCLGALTVWLLLRRPSPSRPRRALVGLAAATTGVAVVAALTLPAFRSAPAPLVLVRQAGATATRSITDASQA
ncbi:MAG: hypothetical protein JOZ37_18265, partial [Actinobacteria bacterium]|nr:hypothetical protein [Actinomycetota bacterium]MBV9936735.1 hypothetical protein [Actinomycetota bacterium]